MSKSARLGLLEGSEEIINMKETLRVCSFVHLDRWILRFQRRLGLQILLQFILVLLIVRGSLSTCDTAVALLLYIKSSCKTHTRACV